MNTLRLRYKASWAIATDRIAGYIAASMLATSFAFADSFANSSKAIAQPVGTFLTCPQLNNRRYVVMLNSPANLLPQLPEFLAIAAVPCAYLNNSMTFFGGFDNIQSASFRANQLRQLGLDGVVHSFGTKLTDVPEGLRASIILVELNNEPNLVIQQVQSVTGKGALLAAFNNRSVILAAPISSPQIATAIAAQLRGQGLAAQVVSASLLASPSASNSSPNNLDNTVPQKTGNRIYRVLVPNANANTLKEIRAFAPDAFVTIFKGKSYIQARTYTDRGNAHRERDRLNARFAGTVLLQD